MPRGGIEKPIGYEVIWKDRPGRTRIKVKVAQKKFMDKRTVEYLKYHPNEDLKGYVIVHLDDAELTKTGIKLAELKCQLKKAKRKIKRN